MIEELNSIKNTVHSILMRFPQTRDCDRSLWLSVMNLKYDLRGILGDKYPAFRALLLQEGVVPFESVSRCRRKLQEKHEEIRGRLYYDRQKEAEEVKEWALQ